MPRPVPKEIKQLIRQGRVIFSEKASHGMLETHIGREDVAHAILYGRVHKKMKDPKTQARYVYVIFGDARDGRPLYLQGKVLTPKVSRGGERRFFVISAHRRESVHA